MKRTTRSPLAVGRMLRGGFRAPNGVLDGRSGWFGPSGGVAAFSAWERA